MSYLIWGKWVEKKVNFLYYRKKLLMFYITKILYYKNICLKLKEPKLTRKR